LRRAQVPSSRSARSRAIEASTLAGSVSAKIDMRARTCGSRYASGRAQDAASTPAAMSRGTGSGRTSTSPSAAATRSVLRLLGGFPSGPLELERTKELIGRHLLDGSLGILDVGGAPVSMPGG
jgi:hypothetical protein